MLWGIHVVNILCGRRLIYLGLVPRRLSGLPGIVAAPFLHADFPHLFFNTVPLVMLIPYFLQGGYGAFFTITAWIVGLGGVLTWLLGRNAIHIGASGLVMGYWGYVLVATWLAPSAAAILLILVFIYYFGGFLASLIPVDECSSYEGHLLGLLSGMVVAYSQLS